MKKLNKLFAILLCCIGTVSVTSCLNDDDNGGVDPEVYKTYLTNISGIYYGNTSDWRYANKIYFYNDTITGQTTKEKTDSITGISGSFGKDSTFAITGVPGRVLAKEIPDDHMELKEAIENAPAKTIRGGFVFFDINQYAFFMVYPQSVTYEDLTYGGEKHKVTVVFWSPSSTGIFGYVNNKQIVQASLYMAAIYVDDKKEIEIFDVNDGDSMQQLRAQLLIQLSR